jgi:hypothetical protein
VRSRSILTLAIGLPLIAVLGVVLLFTRDARQDLSIGDLVGEDDWSRSLMPDMRPATDELCGTELPCVEAVTSRTLTMFRFEDRDDAVAAAERFGDDGYLTGWIAVRYEPDALTEAQRTDFEYGISCVNTWVGEDGQDC